MAHMSFHPAVLKIPSAGPLASLRSSPKDLVSAGSSGLAPQKLAALHPVPWHWSLVEGEEREEEWEREKFYLVCREYSNL